jgi:hypothetical protein
MRAGRLPQTVRERIDVLANKLDDYLMEPDAPSLDTW